MKRARNDELDLNIRYELSGIMLIILTLREGWEVRGVGVCLKEPPPAHLSLTSSTLASVIIISSSETFQLLPK